MDRTKQQLAAIALASALVVLVTVPVEAQNYRFDIGLNGGAGYWTEMLDEEHLGTTDGSVKFEWGWLVGAQGTFWARPRLGLRANLGFTDRPLELDGGADDVNLINDVNLWSASGDVMIRFREPSEEWLGREFLPYLALGVGAKFVNPPGETTVGGQSDGGAIFTAGTNTFLLEDGSTLMGLVGLGGDLRLSPNFALRLEAGDRLFDAPIELLEPAAGGGFQRPANEEDVGKLTHELYATAGLHWLAGLQERERVVVVPPPAPAAPPAPAPAPPREEALTVCVVDPTAAGGLRTLNAVYLPDQGDTLVTVNGSRVPLSTATGSVLVASSADWYIAGRPLTVRLGSQTAEYVTYAGPRQIAAQDLEFVGTVNGLPVYASRNDIMDIRDELAEVREAERTGDLEDILEERRELREEFDDIQVLYVPLRSTGCVFQAVQRVEEVRKTRGASN
ncbi:MAG: hypothetical protein ACRELD_01755 [Longimicrobiales bacterium]